MALFFFLQFSLAFANVVISTNSGEIIGIEDDISVSFLSIPYVAPPIGELRWRAPQEHPGWSKPHDSRNVTLRKCPQPEIPPWTNAELGSVDEDCLTLNVHTPRPLPSRPLPVLVWLHGGGYMMGSSNNRFYNGSYLAAWGDVIVVVPNYRLGIFGFLAHHELSREGEERGEGVSGSYGILDQRAVLKWVQKHIHAFGGDPKRVTIFGESAGAFSVLAHVISPESDGLFHGAIAQSSPTGISGPPIKEAEKFRGNWILNATGCAKGEGKGKEEVECLRSLSTATVFQAARLPRIVAPALRDETDPTWSYTLKDYVWPADVNLLEALEKGKFSKVPLIIGTTKDETSIFMSRFLLAFAENTWTETLHDSFGSTFAKEFIETYEPTRKERGNWQALVKAGTDAGFLCSSRLGAHYASTHGSRTYVYIFQAITSTKRGRPFGSSHAMEIPYVWHQSHEGSEFDHEDAELSKEIVDFWTAFAHSIGKEGSEYLKSKNDLLWPPFKHDNMRAISFHLKSQGGIQEITIAPEGGPAPDTTFTQVDKEIWQACPLWDNLYSHYRTTPNNDGSYTPLLLVDKSDEPYLHLLLNTYGLRALMWGMSNAPLIVVIIGGLLAAVLFSLTKRCLRRKGGKKEKRS